MMPGVGQAFRMRNVVAWGELQRGNFESVLYHQWAKFIGVGSVSEAACKMNESWPAGRPCWILAQTLFFFSNLQVSENLLWTVSLERWSSHLWESKLFQIILDALGKVDRLMSDRYCLARRRVSVVAGAIPASLRKAGEESREAIS